jgi:hypothetical protein
MFSRVSGMRSRTVFLICFDLTRFHYTAQVTLKHCISREHTFTCIKLSGCCRLNILDFPIYCVKNELYCQVQIQAS